MRTKHLNHLIMCAVFASTTPCLVNAVEPMSESDMGDVSAISGDILNVMGSPASGGENGTTPETSNPQLDTSKNAVKTRVAYTESENSDTKIDPNLNLVPSQGDPADSITRYKISTRTDGELGTSTIYYDENEHNTDAYQEHDNKLTIDQNVRVDRVDVIQPRHSIHSPSRGNTSFSNIEVNGSTTIIAR